MDVRLNKYISDTGFCSRREADRLIEDGKVTVNNKVAEMGVRVTENDIVKVNGRVVKNRNKTVYIALNKPIGIVSTTDPAERKNIVDFINYPIRIFNIGRLDKLSEGLILLTNDGNIVNKILRAANNHDKEYEVVVNRPITDEFLRRMASGIPILGTVTKKCQIEQIDRFKFRIILTQGLNRQIRRMCEFLGYEVVKLKRLRIMNIKLGNLPTGHWRELTNKEISVLTQSLEGSEGGEEASVGAGAGSRSKKSSPRPTSKVNQRDKSNHNFKSQSRDRSKKRF